METQRGYGQFRPVAMAAEVVCSRWTPLLMRELLAGSTRFNELRRGVPRMSPALLSKRCWWLIVDGSVDLCSVDPGFEVDLYVETDLRTMTAIWMGFTTVRAEVEAAHLELTGHRDLRQSMQRWLGLGPFAKERKPAAARARRASNGRGLRPRARARALL